MEKGQKVIVCPGTNGGALLFKKELGLDFSEPEIIVSETSTLPYACRIVNPEEVAQKIIHHSQAPGGISRFNFQMDTGLPHEKLLKCIELIGRKVLLIVNS